MHCTPAVAAKLVPNSFNEIHRCSQFEIWKGPVAPQAGPSLALFLGFCFSEDENVQILFTTKILVGAHIQQSIEMIEQSLHLDLSVSLLFFIITCVLGGPPRTTSFAYRTSFLTALLSQVLELKRESTKGSCDYEFTL